MKERIFAQDSVQTSFRSRRASFRPLVWMLFLVSVGTFAESWAQTMALPTDAAMLDAYRKHQTGKKTAAPETYRAPDFDLVNDSIPFTMPPVPGFADLPPEPDSLELLDSLPKPAGDLTRFGSEFFRTRGETYKPPVGPVSPQYQLGPGDRLFITTWGRVDLEYELAVDPTGQVHIPKVGGVRAFGLSLSEFEQKLRKRLAQIYSDFKLNVTVSQIRAVQVHVFGEVVRPGTYTLNALSSLLDVLTAAGGPNDRGSFRHIKHTRKIGKSRTVDLYDFFADGNLTADASVGDGDIIFVPVAGSQVKIRGKVRRPGIYELTKKTRLSDAMALAGGTTADAYLGRVLVDRFDENDQRRLLDCNLSDPAKIESEDVYLVDGDDISVYPVYTERQNVVWISGAIKHPGAYEHRPGMTIYQLLSQAGGLAPEAYLFRSDLERYPADTLKSLEHVVLHRILEDTLSGPRLKPRDRLVVYDRSHLQRERVISIEGAVKTPGEYALYENMRLSDLVFRAGNPVRSAYLYRAEIARLERSGRTKIIYAELEDIINNPGTDRDPFLTEEDQVYIREIPRWRSQERIELSGEVPFPGMYALSREGETLWELLERAGGLTNDAFKQGTVFTRTSISDHIKRADYERIIQSSVELKEDSLGIIRPSMAITFEPERMTRLVIDMEQLIGSDGATGNIALRDGDQIFIPRQPSGILVMGAVAAPGTILHEIDKSLKYYVTRAGDYTRQSHKGATRLIKANGRVFSGGEAKSRKVELGDAVFVPQRIKRDRDWWKIITGSVTVITGMATTALLIGQLN